MSRPGLTAEQVFAAADQLAAASQPVTVQTLRAALGAGSFTTLANHLRSWREQSQAASPASPLPPAVAGAAQQAITLLWQTAWQQAQQDVEAVRLACQTQVQDTLTQTKEALHEIARLETAHHEVAEQLADQALHLEDQRQALATTQAQLAGEQARTEQLQIRIVELKSELEAARVTAASMVEECGRLRGELAANVGHKARQNSKAIILEKAPD